MSIQQAANGHEYASTKRYDHNIGLSCAFRQWRADSHCHFLHGYAVSVRFEFACDKLDERNWVVDFGGLKTLKKRLEDLLDHKTLVAEDDPHLSYLLEMHELGILDVVVLPSVGCEALARIIFDRATEWLRDEYATKGSWPELRSVEVAEHTGNSAIYRKKANANG